MNAENKNCLYELNLLFGYNAIYSMKKCSTTFITFDKICYIVLIHVIIKLHGLIKMTRFKNLFAYQNIKVLTAHIKVRIKHQLLFFKQFKGWQKSFFANMIKRDRASK